MPPKKVEKKKTGWKATQKEALACLYNKGFIDPTTLDTNLIDLYYALDCCFEPSCTIERFWVNFKNFFKDFLTAEGLKGKRCSKDFLK